jgi:hypothetical protein
VDAFVPAVEIGRRLGYVRHRGGSEAKIAAPNGALTDRPLTPVASADLFGKMPVMGERQNGPLGLHLRIDGKFAPGFPHSGLPLRLVVPGQLGSSDWHVAAGTSRSKEHATRHAASPLSPLEKFKKALIAKQVANRVAHGKKAILGLDAESLSPIPGGERMQMKSEVAPLFKAMWDEIVSDHKARAGATAGDSIGVASAYRSAKQDEGAWQRAFPKYLGATREVRLKTRDEYGPKALEIIFRHMNGKKAPPGFSGHTHGIAVDLTTTEKGQKWIVNSNYEHQVGWQKTWLYQWLVANAWKHKFYQLKTETWHWEYHKDRPPTQCWDGKTKGRPIPRQK